MPLGGVDVCLHSRLVFQALTNSTKTRLAPKRPGRARHSRAYSETASRELPPPRRLAVARPPRLYKKTRRASARALSASSLRRAKKLATCRLSAKARGLSSWTCARKQILLYPADGDPARGRPGKRDCLPLAQGRPACAHRARRSNGSPSGSRRLGQVEDLRDSARNPAYRNPRVVDPYPAQSSGRATRAIIVFFSFFFCSPRRSAPEPRSILF